MYMLSIRSRHDKFDINFKSPPIAVAMDFESKYDDAINL